MVSEPPGSFLSFSVVFMKLWIVKESPSRRLLNPIGAFILWPVLERPNDKGCRWIFLLLVLLNYCSTWWKLRIRSSGGVWQMVKFRTRRCSHDNRNIWPQLILILYQRAILVTGSAFHMKTCSFSREFTKCHHSFVQFCFRIHCDDDGWVLKVGEKTLREGFTGFHWCSLTKFKNLMSSFDLSSS